MPKQANGQLVPVDQLAGEIARPMPPQKRLAISSALELLVKMVARQDKSLGRALDYAGLVIENERQLGRELKSLVSLGKPKMSNGGTFKLEDLGITRNRSSRAQRLADLADQAIAEYLNGFRDKASDGRLELPTLSGLYLHANNGGPPIALNTGECAWYTPSKYLEAARKTMGGIDLDPASCAAANKTVRARRFYDLDGCGRPWSGRVFINPPFDQLREFSEKLASELDRGKISQVIFLGPNYSDSQWWQLAASRAAIICHTNHRIRFIESETGQLADSPTNGHTFFYCGDKAGSFEKHFRQFGITSKP